MYHESSPEPQILALVQGASPDQEEKEIDQRCLGTPEAPDKHTRNLPVADKAVVFRRDHWLCHWCKRPVILAQAMRLLELEVRSSGNADALALYNVNSRRDLAPLLDELQATVDHVHAFSAGGASHLANYCTACCKCNYRKGAQAAAEWEARIKLSPVKGKYGEPQHWDGLSSIFVILALRYSDELTTGEREWLRALKEDDPASSPKPKAPTSKLEGIGRTHAATASAVNKPKAPTSKFEGMGGKKDGTTWPAPSGWGSPERPYSSLSAMQNDCRNYNRTLLQYREISAEGLAGEWIALETPALDEM